MKHRHPPSTIYRYIDLPYTQTIRTHNTDRHNTTPTFLTLVQAPYHSPPTPHSPPQPKHRHTSNTPPASTGLVKPKPNPHIDSPPHLPRRPEPNRHTFHTIHQLLLSHIPHSSLALDSIHEPHVSPTCSCHALNTTTPPRPPHQHCRHHPTIPLSQHTHMQHKQQYTHHSHRTHRTHCTHIGYRDNLKDRPRTAI